MNDIYSFISHLSCAIERSLNTTFKICHKVSCMYKEELSTLPFSIDILSESLHSEYKIALSNISYLI